MNLQPFGHTKDCEQCAAASELRFWSLFTEGLGMLFCFAVVIVGIYFVFGLVWG